MTGNKPITFKGTPVKVKFSSPVLECYLKTNISRPSPFEIEPFELRNWKGKIVT